MQSRVHAADFVQTLQRFSARAPAPRHACATAVDAGEHSRTINPFIAALVRADVDRLLSGRCRWIATYVDLDAGTLRSVSADPKPAAALTGLHPNALAPTAVTQSGARE